MPSLLTPAVPAGTLAAREQPTLPVATGLALRPWRDDDVPVLVLAYADGRHDMHVHARLRADR